MSKRAIALAIVICTTGGRVLAIPAFARRYQTACTTCHVLPPQLNSQGQAFRANGFRMPSGEGRRQDADVQLGAPEWEGLFPNAFLPGTLPDTAPLAGLVYASVGAERGKVTTEETTLILGLLSAGNLGRRASWFAAGGFGPEGAAIERMWLSFDRLAGPWLNVRGGYLEAAVVPFSRYTHRLSYEGYLPFETAGPAGLALSASRTAVEIFGAGSDPGPLRGLQYTLGFAARPATGGLAGDGYARVSYKFGGIAAAGDQSGEPGRLAPAIAPLDELASRPEQPFRSARRCITCSSVPRSSRARWRWSIAGPRCCGPSRTTRSGSGPASPSSTRPCGARSPKRSRRFHGSPCPGDPGPRRSWSIPSSISRANPLELCWAKSPWPHRSWRGSSTTPTSAPARSRPSSTAKTSRSWPALAARGCSGARPGRRSLPPEPRRWWLRPTRPAGLPRGPSFATFPGRSSSPRMTARRSPRSRGSSCASCSPAWFSAPPPSSSPCWCWAGW